MFSSDVVDSKQSFKLDDWLFFQSSDHVFCAPLQAHNVEVGRHCVMLSFPFELCLSGCLVNAGALAIIEILISIYILVFSRNAGSRETATTSCIFTCIAYMYMYAINTRYLYVYRLFVLHVKEG